MDERNHQTQLREKLDEMKLLISNGDENSTIGSRTARIYMTALKDYSLEDVIGGIELAMRSWKQSTMPMPADFEKFIKRYRGEKFEKISKTAGGKRLTRTDFVVGAFAAPLYNRLLGLRPFLQYLLDYRLNCGTDEQKQADGRTFVSLMGLYNDMLRAINSDCADDLQSTCCRFWKWLEIIQDWSEKRFNGLASPEYVKLIAVWTHAVHIAETQKQAFFCDLSPTDMEMARSWSKWLKSPCFDWQGVEKARSHAAGLSVQPSLLEPDIEFSPEDIKRITQGRTYEYHQI